MDIKNWNIVSISEYYKQGLNDETVKIKTETPVTVVNFQEKYAIVVVNETGEFKRVNIENLKKL